MSGRIYRSFNLEYQPSYTYKNDGTFDLDEILDFYEHQSSQKQQKQTAQTGNFEQENINNMQNIIFGQRSYTHIQTQLITSNNLRLVEKNINLNKFVRNQTLLYLKGLQKCKVLCAKEIQAIEKYQKSGNSFQSHFQLFKNNQALKKRCLQFYQSSEFIVKIMRSRTCFQRKVLLLKFLQDIKECIITQDLKKRWDYLRK